MLQIIISISVSVIAATITGIGFLTYLRNPNKYRNNVFFAMSLAIGLWMVANYYSGATSIEGITQMFYIADYAIAPFTTALIMLFCRDILSSSKKIDRFSTPKHIAVGSVVLILSVLSIIGLIVNVELIDGESMQTEQALFLPYIAIVASFLIAALVYLVRARINVKGAFRVQVSTILVGMVIMIFLGAAPGVFFQLFLEEDGAALTAAESVSYVGVLVFTAASSYAIVKHRLFDPRLALIRLLAYILSFLSFIAGVGLASVLVARVLFDFDLSISNIFVYSLVSIATILFYPALKRFYDLLTKKLFYQAKYNDPKIRADLLKLYSVSTQTSELVEATNNALNNALNLKHSHVFVYNESGKCFDNHLCKSDYKRLKEDFAEIHRINDDLISIDSLSSGKLKKVMRKHEVDVLVKVKDGVEEIGFILLGPKSSGSIYYQDDYKFISNISRNFNLAISNSLKFEKLEGFNEKLQKEVERATQKLKRSNQKLKEHDVAKSEFMSMTSHQLKPQLTAVENFAAMLEEDKDLKEEQLDLVQLCRRGVHRSLSIITGILDLPQFEIMDLKLNKSKVDLVTMTKVEMKRFDSICKNRDIKLSLSAPKSMKATVDNTKLAEAFSNIVRNAIYYSPDSSAVKVTLSKSKNHAVFEVEDSGQGVPKEERKKLFTKFYRSQKAKKTQPSGTGIGLFFLKKVAEAHDGEAYYKPIKDGGSIFGFKIPI